MKKTILIFFILLVIAANDISACTVAVISGKYTRDGRPLLWKNRDIWAVNNKIMYFDGDDYSYMGLVNSVDTTGKSLWIGMNDQGFAIMNSNSYNLNLGDTAEHSGLEGRVIKYALATCATVQDFQDFSSFHAPPTVLFWPFRG